FSDAKVDCEIDAGTLRTLISRTLFAAAAEHSRYAINGVLFERDGKRLRLVATDGRRLAVAKGEARPASGAPTKSTCIVPTKALNLVSKLIVDPEETIKLAVEENQALFSV